MALTLSRLIAEALREQTGFDVTGHPDFIVLIDPPDRWPADQPWPPRVTISAPPCWHCLTRAR